MRNYVLIHAAPHFELAGVATVTSAGRTVELFQRHPRAKRPRWQRLVCLTLS